MSVDLTLVMLEALKRLVKERERLGKAGNDLIVIHVPTAFDGIEGGDWVTYSLEEAGLISTGDECSCGSRDTENTLDAFDYEMVWISEEGDALLAERLSKARKCIR